MAAIVNLFNSFIDWIKSLFWKQEMELTLVGLQNSGKTTLVNVISVNHYFFNIYNTPSHTHAQPPFVRLLLLLFLLFICLFIFLMYSLGPSRKT